MTETLKSLLLTYPITGGSGKSFEDAIIFNPGISEDEYVAMEYEIADLLFSFDPDIDEATFKMQSLYSRDGKDYDVLTYLASNFGDIADDSIGFEDKEINIYFDITANFGKY